MSEPFLGEIRRISFDFAPKGWALCNGQLLAISQNAALFSILGTTYGGNGVTTFALPDLRSRIPMHWGNGSGLSPRVLGETDGVETVTLTASQIPTHNHSLVGANTSATTSSPNGTVPAQAHQHSGGAVVNSYAAAASLAPMAPLALGSTGGSQAHDNLPPYLCINYVIALQGIFPSRN